jgi:NAD(P)-dependent dehydrogenase (short-subunit alcohol dehydrogenase family)
MRTLFYFICLAIIATPSHAAESNPAGAMQQKAVLVTGASTGIGRKITETIAAKGYFVYAGARKQEDLDDLNRIENVQALRLDVTVQDEIDAAVKTVRDGGRGLYGLVNNAGVAVGGPLIEVGEEDLKWLFDVNVFGVYRVTQAFAPLIIESKGRIMNIGSISGILSGTFFGQYSMTKHAIEAYTDALAQEMARFDVKVSVIEPGNYKSEIRNTAFKRMKEDGYIKEGSPYAEQLRQFLNQPSDRSQYKEPDEVADAVLHALFDDAPKLRYMVVPNRQEAAVTINRSLQKVVELNRQQPYSFNRDELIEMLDQSLGTDKE